MFTGENIGGVLNSGGNVLTTDGDKIGSIGRVYADDSSGDPTFVRVKTGLFGTSESFVPLEGARVEGNDILVPYSKEQVKDAPRVAEDGPLEPTRKTASTPTTASAEAPPTPTSPAKPVEQTPAPRPTRPGMKRSERPAGRPPPAGPMMR